jgi:RimJ/RimL family protein N-acetyltransferase
MPTSQFLVGDDCSLHPLDEAHLPFLRDLLNDPRVRRTMYEHTPRTLHRQREWWESLGESDEVHLLVVPADSEAPVGTVSLMGIVPKSGLACVGYAITPEEWGNGYATAAVELLRDYAFDERRIEKLWASVYETNPASGRVLEKAGFGHEATHRKEAYVEGQRVDVWYYGLLRDEWRSDE